MKVVKEIIGYLNGRRRLAADDLHYLRTRGFIDFAEEAELLQRHAVRIAQEDAEPEVDAYDIEDALTPRVRHRRTFRRTRSHLQPEADAISMRVLELWPSWQGELSSLHRYAAQVASVRTIEDCLNAIKRMPAATLDAVTAATLQRGRPSLPELWRGLGFDGYREGIAGPDDRGPATVALREILRGRGPAEMGSYAAALRYRGFSRLYALVQAQRAVLASVGRVMSSDPSQFDRALFERHYEPGCYWALTIIVSGLVLQQPNWPVRVHAPARPFPTDHPELAVAVKCACMMDVRLLARLLATDGELPALFRCPRSWDRGYFAPADVIERAA